MKLAAWRKRKGWSQQELADALGCVLSSVARYETRVRIPEEGMMIRIFELSGGEVTPNDFYALPDLSLPQLPFSQPDREAA